MAGSRKTLNPLTDTPTSKTDITKPFMLAYMERVAKPEDIAWFKTVVNNPDFRKMYTNRLTNQPYEDIDIPKVREQFCMRFYPQLLAKKPRGTFTDVINNL